jgi:hypothetical protein
MRKSELLRKRLWRCDAAGHTHAHGISHCDLELETLAYAKKTNLSTITIVESGFAKAARARACRA